MTHSETSKSYLDSELLKSFKWKFYKSLVFWSSQWHKIWLTNTFRAVFFLFCCVKIWSSNSCIIPWIRADKTFLMEFWNKTRFSNYLSCTEVQWRKNNSHWNFGGRSCAVFYEEWKSFPLVRLFALAIYNFWFLSVKLYLVYRSSSSCSLSTKQLQYLQMNVNSVSVLSQTMVAPFEMSSLTKARRMVDNTRRFLIIYIDVSRSQKFKSAISSTSLNFFDFLHWLVTI